MHRCAEATELDLFSADNLFPVTVTPLDGDVRVGIGIHEHIESAFAGVKLR